MTEDEYIIATNRVKVSMAKSVLHEVLSGENWGVSDDELAELRSKLIDIERRLFRLCEERCQDD